MFGPPIASVTPTSVITILTLNVKEHHLHRIPPGTTSPSSVRYH